MADTSATRHRLRVRVGSSADEKDLRPIAVNDDANPVLIESSEFVGRVVVRIKGFDKTFDYEQGQKEDGLDLVPESKWFHLPGADSHLCSIQIQARFKQEWPCDKIVYGNQFDHPLRLPPLSSIALKFVQFIDPGLKADIYCDKPWAFSPLIATMNTVHVSEWPDKENTHKGDESSEHSVELPQWPSPNGEHITEDTSLMFHVKCQEAKSKEEETASETDKAESRKESLEMKGSAEKVLKTSERRSYFAKANNLAQHCYRPDQVYGFDFFNPYLDFTNFTLKVPGFSVDVKKYWDGQPLTYIVKSEDSSVVFMAVQFELVPVTDVTIE